jgi:hypothetical protein
MRRMSKTHFLFLIVTTLMLLLLSTKNGAAKSVTGTVVSVLGDEIALDIGANDGLRPGNKGIVYYIITKEGK